VQLRTPQPAENRGSAVGREIPDHLVRDEDIGSIIIVIATDAPLIPTQLKRVARRASLDWGRHWQFSQRRLGDIFYRLFNCQ